jgi:hypothetical protein
VRPVLWVLGGPDFANWCGRPQQHAWVAAVVVDGRYLEGNLLVAHMVVMVWVEQKLLQQLGCVIHAVLISLLIFPCTGHLTCMSAHGADTSKR